MFQKMCCNYLCICPDSQKYQTIHYALNENLEFPIMILCRPFLCNLDIDMMFGCLVSIRIADLTIFQVLQHFEEKIKK